MVIYNDYTTKISGRSIPNPTCVTENLNWIISEIQKGCISLSAYFSRVVNNSDFSASDFNIKS